MFFRVPQFLFYFAIFFLVSTEEPQKQPITKEPTNAEPISKEPTKDCYAKLRRQLDEIHFQLRSCPKKLIICKGVYNHQFKIIKDEYDYCKYLMKHH